MSSNSGRKRRNQGYEQPIKKLHKMPSAQDFTQSFQKSGGKIVVPKFEPRTPKQALAYNTINRNAITFLKGKVGSGKTRIAVQKALEEYAKGNYEKIIFLRATVTAEEEIGYLKGTAEEKIAPYIASMLEPAYKLLGGEMVDMLIEEKIIEYIPIGFLRGRNFENSFVIVDELQNLTFNQMMLIMTRMLDSSKMVLMGDDEQIDLKEKFASAINEIKIFNGAERIGMITFGEEDIVRAEITKIINKCLVNRDNNSFSNDDNAVVDYSQNNLGIPLYNGKTSYKMTDGDFYIK